MNYTVHITASAERNLLKSSDYIEFVLKNPKADDDLLDEVESKINSLADFPEKINL